MASWGKEHNKSRLRMPVRVGATRNTMGHLDNGSTLNTALPAPRNVVKTPQGLKLVPAKRNILGQCLTNSPSAILGSSSQAKERIPRKIPRLVYNTRVEALMVADANQNLNKASNLRPQTSSPLVPLEEYEKHHKGKSNIGIFKDFEKFRTLPEPHTARVPFLPSEISFAEGVSGVCAEKRKSNSVSKYKKKYSSKPPGVKKVSEILHQPSRLGQTLIPISVPKSPHILYSTRKDPLKTFALGHTPALIVNEHGDLLSSTSSVLDIPYVYKTNTTLLTSTDEHESELQHSDSQLEQQNDTLTRSIEQLCGNYEKQLPNPKDFMKHAQSCKVSLTNNAQTCSSFVPKPLHNGNPNESQTTHHSCDLHCMYSCVYPILEVEQKYISLLQEQYDLQKQKADLQHKETICLQKMIKFREENINLLCAQSARPTEVKTNIVDIMPLPFTPIPEITTSPVPTRRRRSARLAMQSKSEEDESQLIATTNSVIDIHTQLSMTEDICSTKNDLDISTTSSTKKRDTRRKSVVNYYGELRSSFKHLLQTPKETPGPGKSAKKVQFTVQDTPARFSSNIMKQLNTLYDS